MRVWKQIVLGLTALSGIAGCSTDLEVNAPYKEITVVYGLLNRTDRIHWVRINKAFLGTDNAFVYATIPDSSEYTDAQLQNAVVEEIDNGVVVNTYPLQDSILNNRVDGTFYNPVHKIYYFRTTSDLDQDNDYRVNVTAKGNAISATTAIVNDFNITTPVLNNPNGKIGLVNSGGNYVDFEVKWNSGKDGRRYQVDYVFKYTEVRNGTDSTDKFISVRMGTRITGSLDGGEALSATIDGQSFFEYLGSVIQDDPSIEKRVIKGLDFSFWVASDEFNTYLQLSDPVSGIVEERPDFTNVANGYGLFGGRYFKGVNNKQFNNETVDELVNGQYTGTLRFCSPLTTDPDLGCN